MFTRDLYTISNVNKRKLLIDNFNDKSEKEMTN